MRILWIYSPKGNNDHATIDFDNSIMEKKSLRELWDIAYAMEDHTYFSEDENLDFAIECLEFGEVDPKFVLFVKNYIYDYDTAESKDFFILD